MRIRQTDIICGIPLRIELVEHITANKPNNQNKQKRCDSRQHTSTNRNTCTIRKSTIRNGKMMK